jgi:hypothetical protein
VCLVLSIWLPDFVNYFLIMVFKWWYDHTTEARFMKLSRMFVECKVGKLETETFGIRHWRS